MSRSLEELCASDSTNELRMISSEFLSLGEQAMCGHSTILSITRHALRKLGSSSAALRLRRKRNAKATNRIHDTFGIKFLPRSIKSLKVASIYFLNCRLFRQSSVDVNWGLQTGTPLFESHLTDGLQYFLHQFYPEVTVLFSFPSGVQEQRSIWLVSEVWPGRRDQSVSRSGTHSPVSACVKHLEKRRSYVCDNRFP